MAQLASFAVTAGNVVTDTGTRRITISSEVVAIDGTLDPPTGYDDWGGWTIICQSSGGFRSIAGANGTLGGGVQSLVIIEASNAHRFGSDNFQNNTARFSGDGTNTLKYHNIVWIVQPGSRSDFDIYRGSTSNGSQGCKVELSGVYLHQQTQSGQAAHYNHYSARATIKVHPQVGFGLRIRNETNGPAIEFSTAIQGGATVAGLVIDNVSSPTNNSNGSRCAVRLNPISAGGTMTLSNLNTPSIAAVNGASNKNLLLIDPVGRPTRADWGNQYHGNFEIRRTVPFEFTGDQVPTGTVMNAIAQASGGANATATMGGSSGEIQVRTDYSADGATGGAWTTQNTYKFYMTALGIRKLALTTTRTIAAAPATIAAQVVKDELPDGTAIASITQPSQADDLSDIIRVVKNWETANPTLDPASPLAYVDGSKVKFNEGYSVTLSSTATELITVSANSVTVKCGTALAKSNGLATVDASGTNRTITTTSVVEADDVFLLDSSGQKSVIDITSALGASVLFSLVDTSDGATIGSATLTSTGAFTIATKGLTTGYALVAKRPGYRYFTTPIDLTGGGLREVSVPAQEQLIQPDGIASYVGFISTDGITVSDSSSGTTPGMRIGIGNTTRTARYCFKAVEDFLASAAGAKFMGLAGQQPTFVRDTIKGDQFYCGAHCKFKRSASTDINAKVRASLFSNDDAPVDGVNGDIQTVEGLNVSALGTALLVEQDFDPDETGTQSVWGKLVAIADAIETGGGGGATAQQVWEYTGTRALSTDPPTASDNATAVWGATTRTLTTSAAPSASDVADAVWSSDDAVAAPPTAATVAASVWGATTRTLTTSAAPSADDVADAVWGSDLDPNLNGVQDIRTAIRKLNSLTAAAITDAVWSRVIDGGITSDLTITPEAKAGDGFRIPADDAVLVATGDAFTFSNTGGYGGIDTTTIYYAFKNSSREIFIYESKADTTDPSASWVRPTGNGTPGDVRIVVPEARPIGTAGVALHRILAAIHEIDGTQDAHSQATGAIGTLMNTLMSPDFVESGISLKKALEILTAIMAGKVTVINDGTTFTYHRLDADSTAVINASASEAGRTAPTVDP